MLVYQKLFPKEKVAIHILLSGNLPETNFTSKDIFKCVTIYAFIFAIFLNNLQDNK